MDDPADPSEWTAAPSVKAKNAVQRNVTALLDALAPERVLTRGDRLASGPVEQHRMPTGCVLQAATAALSVSWFPDADVTAPLGELRVVVWRGVVSRRGARPVKDGATIVREMVLHPIVASTDDRVWRSMEGTDYDTATLAAECLAMLEQQVGGAEPEREG